jgi:hypothetical protein
MFLNGLDQEPQAKRLWESAGHYWLQYGDENELEYSIGKTALSGTKHNLSTGGSVIFSPLP